MINIKRILPFVFLLCLFAGISQEPVQTKPVKEKATKEATVYICDSESSYAYHSSSNCRGIKRCKHGILKVTKTDATDKYGRQACEICY